MGDFYTLIAATASAKQPPFSEPLAKYFFKPLMEGVAAMHDRSSFHGDLKLDNLMSGKDQATGEYLLRIGDFGLMRVFRDAAGSSGQVPVLRAQSSGQVSLPGLRCCGHVSYCAARRVRLWRVFRAVELRLNTPSPLLAVCRFPVSQLRAFELAPGVRAPWLAGRSSRFKLAFLRKRAAL